MTPEDRRQLAEDLGYSSYTCRIHGRFWTDTTPHCPYCEDNECPNCGRAECECPESVPEETE